MALLVTEAELFFSAGGINSVSGRHAGLWGCAVFERDHPPGHPTPPSSRHLFGRAAARHSSATKFSSAIGIGRSMVWMKHVSSAVQPCSQIVLPSSQRT